MASNATDNVLNSAIDEAMRVLQPMFARPKLRSRLLSKPPFRFIHDIAMAIIQATKFPASILFTDVELESSTFKNSKEAKIAFLEKLIAFVNASREMPIEVESRHIVAGAKPASTVKLLIAFGELAAQDDMDHSSLIQLATRSENIVKEEAKIDDTKSEETRDDFAESKVSADDNDEETKDNDRAVTVGGECNSNSECSMVHSIDRIIQCASIIESLFTE
mmetsp:Transcript_27493/g.43251  ORF Transcript_27493/g.43251 Transcript_27493/m.43251 type:complete len:220 (+) Transcript_27493:72-731(+)